MTDYINALKTGYQWTPDGEGAHVTYTMTSNQGHWADKGSNATAFNADQQEAARAAFNEFAKVANITFQEVHTTSPDSVNIALRAADMYDGLAGYATFPYRGVSDVTIDHAYNTDNGNALYGLGQGDFGFLLMLHEIGHAVGLADAHLVNPMPAALDNVNATIMSYHNSSAGSVGGKLASRGEEGTTPDSLQILDIAAVQQMYGANHNYNAGNDTYTLTGEASVSTLWDGAGNDTLDSTGFAGNATLDLREGVEFISHVGATHMWNAFGANIENARAGSGNDTLIGNDLNNLLRAGDGNDTLNGGFGDDNLNGNKGNDIVNGENGNDVVQGGKGIDNVTGGLGNDFLNGNIGNDLVFGNEGADILHGGKDHDQLFGGAGNDVLFGDKGNDVLNGGTGADIFFFAGASGADVIQDFEQGSDKLQTASTVVSIETQGGDTTVDLGGGNTIHLLGVTDLDASDFI